MFFISNQLSLTDEQFPVDEELGRGSLTTSVSDLATEARHIAQVSMCTPVTVSYPDLAVHTACGFRRLRLYLWGRLIKLV